MQHEPPEPVLEEDEKRRQRRGTGVMEFVGDLAYTVDGDGAAAADLTAAGINGFKTVSREITTAQRQAAGALIDGIRNIPEAADAALGFAGDALGRVVDGARAVGGAVPGSSDVLEAAGDAANVVARTATRAVQVVTNAAGALDVGQAASAAAIVADTAADAIGAVARSASAIEPVLSAGLQAGGAGIEFAAKGLDLAGDAAGLVAGAAQHIDAGAVLQVTGDALGLAADLASVAGSVGLHVVEAVVDGISSLS